MESLLRRSGGYALRFLIAGACCYGIWSSLSLARADYLFHRDTEDSVRAAIRLADGWQYYMRLSELDRAHAPELLATSLRLNPYNAQADIELGLQDEAEGDDVNAEKQLLEAYEVDHTYLPAGVLPTTIFATTTCPHSGNGPAVPPICPLTIWRRSGRSLSFAGVRRRILKRLLRQSSAGNPK